MSDMLEQAIIDAEALKKAAAKNAETLVLEKYSNQIKEAVEQILDEQPEDVEALEVGEEEVVDDEAEGAVTATVTVRRRHVNDPVARVGDSRWRGRYLGAARRAVRWSARGRAAIPCRSAAR